MRLLLLCEDETKHKHVGFFIKLPEELAKQYPEKDPEQDKSPHHITVLYIGKATDEEIEKIEKVGRDVGSRQGPMSIFVAGCASFENQEGQKIAHSMVEAQGLHTLHKELWDGLLKAGIEVKHSHPEFIPHATLSYDGDNYDGPVPEGDWECKSFELWYGTGNQAAEIPLSGSQK